jgi:hypothetical protein
MPAQLCNADLLSFRPENLLLKNPGMVRPPGNVGRKYEPDGLILQLSAWLTRASSRTLGDYSDNALASCLRPIVDSAAAPRFTQVVRVRTVR